MISVLTITNEPTSVKVDIGGSSQAFSVGTQGTVTFVQVPLDGRLGPVTLRMHGRVTNGPAISNIVAPTGFVRSLVVLKRLATDDITR